MTRHTRQRGHPHNQRRRVRSQREASMSSAITGSTIIIDAEVIFTNPTNRVKKSVFINLSPAPGPSIALAMVISTTTFLFDFLTRWPSQDSLTLTISTRTSAPTSTTALPTWTTRRGSLSPTIHGRKLLPIGRVNWYWYWYWTCELVFVLVLYWTCYLLDVWTVNWCKGLTWPPLMRAALETSATGTAIGGSHPDPFLSQPWFIYLLQVQ